MQGTGHHYRSAPYSLLASSRNLTLQTAADRETIAATGAHRRNESLDDRDPDTTGRLPC
jgi:hypothetical protein